MGWVCYCLNLSFRGSEGGGGELCFVFICFVLFVLCLFVSLSLLFVLFCVIYFLFVFVLFCFEGGGGGGGGRWVARCLMAHSPLSTSLMLETFTQRIIYKS